MAPRTTVVADPADVERLVATMDPELLDCRDFGHKWLRTGAQWIDRRNDVYLSLQTCERCKLPRERLMMHGHVITSNIDYAAVPGYTAPPGMGRITGDAKAVVRREGDAAFLNDRSGPKVEPARQRKIKKRLTDRGVIEPPPPRKTAKSSNGRRKGAR